MTINLIDERVFKPILSSKISFFNNVSISNFAQKFLDGKLNPLSKKEKELLRNTGLQKIIRSNKEAKKNYENSHQEQFEKFNHDFSTEITEENFDLEIFQDHGTDIIMYYYDSITVYNKTVRNLFIELVVKFHLQSTVKFCHIKISHGFRSELESLYKEKNQE